MTLFIKNMRGIVIQVVSANKCRTIGDVKEAIHQKHGIEVRNQIRQ